ncbi:MAG: ribbon-helix-helix domain-containing protein [Candidatus Woesearchaeota archaeon]
MEVVTVKFQEDILKRIDESITRHNYNSRTEFIREAVRDKLESLSREQLVREFMKYKGKTKRKTTDEEDEAIRQRIGREILERIK